MLDKCFTNPALSPQLSDSNRHLRDDGEGGESTLEISGLYEELVSPSGSLKSKDISLGLSGLTLWTLPTQPQICLHFHGQLPLSGLCSSLCTGCFSSCFFSFSDDLFYVHWCLPACMSVRGCQIPRHWSYRQFQACHVGAGN